MKKNYFLILVIVITACSTQPPQVTVTSEVTVTLPPASPTPEPTATPEPALPAEIVELQKSLVGTNYAFAWNSDFKSLALTYTDPETKKTSIIPEIVFDEKGDWKRTYTFETPYGTQAEVTIDSRVDKMTVAETSEGKKILDFSAWSLVDGKWVREYKQNTENLQYGVTEAQAILIENGSKDPKDGMGMRSFDEFDENEFTNRYLNVFSPKMKFDGLFNYKSVKETWDPASAIPIWIGPTIKLLDGDDKVKIVDTTFYVTINFTSRTSAIIYRDINKQYQVIFVDADLNDLTNWSPAFKVANPFN